MNRQIRIKNKCVLWNIDKEYVEITHGRRRIFIARVDLSKNFDKKTADALKVMNEKLNRRSFLVLTTPNAEASEVAENCPKIVVSSLYPGKEIEIMEEFHFMSGDLDWFDKRIGWVIKGHRHVICCQEGPIVTIEETDETLTHATLTWTFDAY